MEVEHLNLLVEVTDQFTDDLQSLAAQLIEVGEIADALDESLDFEVNVDDRELDALQRELATTQAQQFGVSAGSGPRIPDPGTALPDGSTDGGGRGSGLIDSAADLSRMRREFGDAFDPTEFFRMGGGIADPSRLLDGPQTEFFDVDGIMEAFMDPLDEIDSDVIENKFDNLDLLRRRGLVDLPSDRSVLQRFVKQVEGLSATALVNLWASLVPLLAQFVLALPAAIAGVAALGVAAIGAAGALAAIAGLGAMGLALGESGGLNMEELTQVLDRLRDSFIEAFGPLARRLAPMFEAGIRGLEELFARVAAQGDVLLRFREEAGALGEFAIDVLPKAIAALGRFADAASPIFAVVGAFIRSNDIIEGFAETLAMVLPELSILGAILVDILPKIIEFSAGFLLWTGVLLKAISFIAGVASALLTLFGIIPGGLKGLGALIGMFLTLITVTALYTKLNGLLAGTMAGSFISSVFTAITGLEALTIAELKAASATQILRAAIFSLMATTGIGLLIAGVGTLAGEFMTVSGNIANARKELSRFDSVASNMNSPRLDGTVGNANGPYVDYSTIKRNTTIVAESRDDGVATANHQSYREQQGKDSYFS